MLSKTHVKSKSKNSDFDEDEITEIKGSFLNYYFQPQVSIKLDQLRMTNISLYSTTPWKEARFISRAILNFFQGNKPRLNTKHEGKVVITDATANIGGNTISFYLNGAHKVNAVEIDQLTCDILKHNLDIYKFPTDTVYCCDYLSIYKKLEQDAVFLDPPWGGPDYKKVTTLDLYLGQTNIIDICVELMEEKKASLIVLKLPLNYNLQGLIKRMPNCNFLTHKIYRNKGRHSYNVVFCF
jgi:16S rRNA G966 N2-methylase RsmD